MHEKTAERRARQRVGGLTGGVILLVLGVLFLASNLGYIVPIRVARWWPFLLIALGLARLLSTTGDGERRRGGHWLLVVGIYGWVSEWRLFGLDWGTAWPIFLIASGLMIASGHTVLTVGWRSRRAWRSRDARYPSGEDDHVE